jgi:3D (Asp-Asp-Asp) domain-containing protein
MIKILLIALHLLLSNQNHAVTNTEDKAAKIYTMYGYNIVPVAKHQETEKKFEEWEITAYTAGKESTGKSKGDKDYGVTASGEIVKEEHTVACPRSLPFGTEIFIPYFDNTFVCEDRGGAITEGHIDVYMEDLDEALEFGRQKLDVAIIEKVEGRLID